MFGLKILLTALVLLFYSDCNNTENNKPLENGSQNINVAVPRNQENIKEIPKDLIVILERKPCYGTCPSYKLFVKSDGYVLFEGLKYTKVKGKIEEKIGAEKLKQLLNEFENADYFNLDDSYSHKQRSSDGGEFKNPSNPDDKYKGNCPVVITDMPTVVTAIQIGGRVKAVSHYLGCGSYGNAELENKLSKLEALENKIDEIVETKRWIGEGK